MRTVRTWMAVLPLLASLLLAQGAAAAIDQSDKGSAPVKTRYKKVTGEVVSIDQNSLVIKSKVKGNLSMAVTKNTDMLGRAAKAGDRAAVNYRIDKNGFTATRIAVPPSAAKQPPKQAAAHSTPTAADRMGK